MFVVGYGLYVVFRLEMNMKDDCGAVLVRQNEQEGRV